MQRRGPLVGLQIYRMRDSMRPVNSPPFVSCLTASFKQEIQNLTAVIHARLTGTHAGSFRLVQMRWRLLVTASLILVFYTPFAASQGKKASSSSASAAAAPSPSSGSSSTAAFESQMLAYGGLDH